MARCNSNGETWCAAIRSGSISTCTTRGRPPTTYARDTSFTPASRCVTSSATPARHVVGDGPSGMCRPQAPCRGQRQRERHDGHVVDLHRLDDPAADAGRNDVEVFVDLLVELHQASLAVFADVVANGDDRLVLAAHRIDVLDAVDLVEDFLQRRGDQLLDFRRRMAGKVDVHVGQRHDDLRVFLARRQAQGRHADNRCQQDQNDREIRLQERSSRCGS